MCLAARTHSLFPVRVSVEGLNHRALASVKGQNLKRSLKCQVVWKQTVTQTESKCTGDIVHVHYGCLRGV